MGKKTNTPVFTRQQIQELAEIYEQPIVLLEPKKYDKALVGYTRDAYENYHAVYDEQLILEMLKTDDDMTEDEALEWYEYNTRRSLPYMGDYVPIIISNNYDL